jgi:hypothetical protein
MGNRSMFVGLDVHKETIDVSIAEGERHGEVRHYGVIASDLEPLDKVVRAVPANSDRFTSPTTRTKRCGIWSAHAKTRSASARKRNTD